MEDIYVLGVDIGGSHIACQLVNLSDCSLIENTYAEVKVAEIKVPVLFWQLGKKR